MVFDLTFPRGGRGARGTGSPDPSGISNPRVYARVLSARKRWVPSGRRGLVRWLWGDV